MDGLPDLRCPRSRRNAALSSSTAASVVATMTIRPVRPMDASATTERWRVTGSSRSSRMIGACSGSANGSARSALQQSSRQIRFTEVASTRRFVLRVGRIHPGQFEGRMSKDHERLGSLARLGAALPNETCELAIVKLGGVEDRQKVFSEERLWYHAVHRRITTGSRRAA